MEGRGEREKRRRCSGLKGSSGSPGLGSVICFPCFILVLLPLLLLWAAPTHWLPCLGGSKLPPEKRLRWPGHTEDRRVAASPSTPLSPSQPPTLPVGQPHGMHHLDPPPPNPHTLTPPPPTHSPSLFVSLRPEKRGFPATKGFGEEKRRWDNNKG